eukprot:jgi/Ulvmu1/8176/UM040_0073.1
MPRALPSSLGRPAELPALALDCTVEYLFHRQTIDEACRHILRSNVDMVGFDMEWWTQFKIGVAPREVALIQLCYDMPPTGQAPAHPPRPQPPQATPLQRRPHMENQMHNSPQCSEPPCKRSCVAADDAPPMRAPRQRSHCVLLHISRTGMPPALRELLESENVAKAGVGINGDAEKLALEHRVRLGGALDIGAELNARVQPQGCELVERTAFTLGDAAARLLRASLPKPPRLRCSNWEAAPLSAEQRRYAALDALASLRCARAALRLPLRKRAQLLDTGPPPWQVSQ